MKQYSGRFVVRIPPELHKKLVLHADQQGYSLNELCCRLLAEEGGTASDLPAWKRAVLDLLPRVDKHFGKALLGVAVFGSQISGSASEESDVDVLIVLDKRVSINRALYRWWEEQLGAKQEMEVNPHFVHLPESTERCSGLWLEIAINHEILYEQGKFLEQRFREIQKLIDTKRVQRKWQTGHPYWVWE